MTNTKGYVIEGINFITALAHRLNPDKPLPV